MKVVLRFKGVEAFQMIRNAAWAASAMDLDDPWYQHNIVKGPRAEISTYTGKGDWKGTTNGKISIIEFNGYRGSFGDGTQFFLTRDFPWEKGEVVRIESSQPKRPLSVDGFNYGKGYVMLPFSGSTKGLTVHEYEYIS